MHDFIRSPLQIGTLALNNRLIQGPLAGYSCAPLRKSYYLFEPPAYAVSEMMSAYDVLHKHTPSSRYLFRAPEENNVCYQLAGCDPDIMAQAAMRVETLGANLIDINCGCPKPKLRKKGMGSALLENSARLIAIVQAMRQVIRVPLTVKIRIQDVKHDIELAKAIEDAGADALIVHGRRWTDDYDISCNFLHIGKIKHAIRIPVIANGDIRCVNSLTRAVNESECDGYMIGRAGCGRPWLYQVLLNNEQVNISLPARIGLFITHVHDLAQLESEHQAMLQSRSLLRYYFKDVMPIEEQQTFYTFTRLHDLEQALCSYCSKRDI